MPSLLALLVPRRVLAIVAALSWPIGSIACLPTQGTMPTRTFRPGAPHETCDEPTWTAASRRLLEARAASGGSSVASILGCNAEVLGDCHIPAAAPHLAADLEGDCTGATHVVRAVQGERIEVDPLSLGDFRLTGTFHGVMRQPDRPYTAYETTMYLAQDGERVTGVTRLRTPDHRYWGDLRFDGRLVGNVLFFHDADVLDAEVPCGSSWCAKGGYLLIDPRDGHLAGPARAPYCAPLSLEVQRVEDRPRVLLPPSSEPAPDRD